NTSTGEKVISWLLPPAVQTRKSNVRRSVLGTVIAIGLAVVNAPPVVALPVPGSVLRVKADREPSGPPCLSHPPAYTHPMPEPPRLRLHWSGPCEPSSRRVSVAGVQVAGDVL